MTEPAVRPVTVTEHVPPADRAHVEGEKVTEPVPVVFENVIVSPVMVPLKPVTVAVQTEVDWTQLTVVVGASTVRAVVPELGTLRSSPG